MKIIFFRTAATVALSIFAISTIGQIKSTDIAAAAQPVDVYAQLARTSSVRVSPDGQYVAMLSPYKGSKAIFVYDLANANAKPKVIPTPRNSIVKSVLWGSNKHVLLQGQSRHFYPQGKLRKHAVLHYRWYATNVETNKSTMLMRDKIADESESYQVVNGGNRAHSLPGDPDHILMSFSEYTNRAVTRYWKVNLDSGKSRPVKTLPFTTASVIRSKDGTEILARSDNQKSGKFTVFAGEYPDEREIYSEKFDSDENPTTFLQTLSDGKLILSREDDDRFSFFTVDMNTGQKGSFSINESALSGHEYGPIFDPYTRDLIGAGYTDDFSREVFFKEPFASWHKKAKKALRGKNVNILSWTEDKTKVTIFAEGEGDAGTYYLFEPNVGQISPLGGTYPELKPSEIGRTTREDYTARDGLEIPAYLTLPPGKTKSSGPMPLVVLAHGGPAGRDDASFDFWAQHIASQGYAVFKPQFRGSTGFSFRHMQEGNGHFGEGMLHDTVDGVKHLIKTGVVDADKVCITGASYGGYQALALPMIEPDMFKCALSLNGVSDIPKMLDYVVALTGSRESSSVKYWHHVMGMDDGGIDKLSQQSPADNPESIKAEIVLMHGTDDGTVPIEQAELMAKAMKKIGQSDDIILLKKDDHNLSLPQSRKKLLEESEKLFARHLK